MRKFFDKRKEVPSYDYVTQENVQGPCLSYKKVQGLYIYNYSDEDN